MVDTENTGQEEQEKLDCNINIEDSGSWKKNISIVIPRGEIDKELDKQYVDLRKSAEIPGFRKGRAPRRLIEKRFGTDVVDQAKMRLLARAFEQIDEDNDFETLGEPDFDPDKVEMPDDGDLTFEYEIEVKPQFELPPLEGVTIEKQVVEINDEKINGALEQLLLRQGKMEEVEAAQADDMVTADITMTIGDIEEPVKYDDHSVWVGPMAIGDVRLEDLAKTLKGAKIGDSLKCSVEVADTHPKEEYRGKKADFAIEVKGIKRLKPAEVSKEFCASLGVEDEAELRRIIEENLENQSDQESRKMMADQVYKYLDTKIEFDLPAGVAARHSDRMMARRYYDLLQQGVPQSQIDQNLEKLRASTSEQAARDLKLSFILEQVSEKLDIYVTDSEVNGHIAQIARSYQRRPEKVRDEMASQGRLETLKNQIRDDKAIGRILEMAKVVDAGTVVAEKADSKEAVEVKEEKPVEKKVKNAKKTAKKEDNSSKTSRKEVKRKPPSADS